MWHPAKVAFRAGYADAGGQFDEANIGYYSWAGGALSRAATDPLEPTAPHRHVSRLPVPAPDGHGERRPGRAR